MGEMTHSPDCWQWHHACARTKVAELERELAEARRDSARLDAFARHPNWDLSHTWDGDDDVYWAVHRVTGSHNDRVWDLIGKGDTPRAAIDMAMGTEPAIDAQEQTEGAG